MNMQVKKKSKENFDKVFHSIAKLAEESQQLASQAVAIYSPIVENIINCKSKDTKQIELILTYMLDFCFDDKMLVLFKKLCRYYYFIDPEATSFYINYYREMWDSENEVKPVRKSNKKQK